MKCSQTKHSTWWRSGQQCVVWSGSLCSPQTSKRFDWIMDCHASLHRHLLLSPSIVKPSFYYYYYIHYYIQTPITISPSVLLSFTDCVSIISPQTTWTMHWVLSESLVWSWLKMNFNHTWTQCWSTSGRGVSLLFLIFNLNIYLVCSHSSCSRYLPDNSKYVTMCRSSCVIIRGSTFLAIIHLIWIAKCRQFIYLHIYVIYVYLQILCLPLSSTFCMIKPAGITHRRTVQEVERLWRDQVHDSCKSSVDVKLHLRLPAREQKGDREAEEVKRGQRDQDRK